MRREWIYATALATLLMAGGGRLAWAQQNQGDGIGSVTVTGALDVTDAYLFRGVRQNLSEVAIWPALRASVPVYSGGGLVRQLTVSGRTFNSLHTGDTGSGGPAKAAWFERDAGAGIEIGLPRGVAVEASFVYYASPNGLFTPARELGLRASLRDGGLGRRLLPYAFVAFEVATGMGDGQLDGGARRGTYLELGAVPGVVRKGRISVDVPLRIGLSLDDYYELAGRDHRYGFFSIGGLVGVTLIESSGAGSWRLQGGAEYQNLGTTSAAFNRGDSHQAVLRLGAAFSTR